MEGLRAAFPVRFLTVTRAAATRVPAALRLSFASASMTNANTESLVVEFKKEVAKMREREATDLEIQSMLEFVEQLTHWRGDVDRESLINALRKAAR